MDIRDILIYFSIKYSGNYDLIYEAIKNKRKVSPEECEKLIKTNKSGVITILDEKYPDYFKSLAKPPLVLYYYGHKEFLYHPFRLSVIGTRKPSEYGTKITEELITEILNKKDVVIVSGLAQGIDSISHRTALKLKKKTIAVLANGIDTFYLKKEKELYNQIKENGLIISEYPLSVNVEKENFRVRNRLIAAISPNLLITEAKKHSGSSLTGYYALEQGKNILCVPRNIDIDSLCNAYIQQGAKLILCANDVLEEIN